MHRTEKLVKKSSSSDQNSVASSAVCLKKGPRNRNFSGRAEQHARINEGELTPALEGAY